MHDDGLDGQLKERRLASDRLAADWIRVTPHLPDVAQGWLELVHMTMTSCGRTHH
jgi:hypothetical protein